jgi:hypothetical protein
VLPTTSVVRIVLSRLSADDSNDSFPVIGRYSTTRIGLLFPGHGQARAHSEVVVRIQKTTGSQTWQFAANGLKSVEARQPNNILLEIAFFHNVPTDFLLVPPLLAASSRLPLGDGVETR